MLSALKATLVQATILNALANFLAQLIDQWKKEAPFVLNVSALLQFITYGIIILPPNFIWQRTIESRYPGFPSREDWRWLRSRRSLNHDRASGTLTTKSTTNNVSSDGHSFIIPIIDNINDTDAKEARVIKDKPASDLPPKWRRWKPSSRYRVSGTSTLHALPEGIRNFLMKFLLDQTICSVGNILLFIWLINLLKGASLAATWAATLHDFGPIMIARLKYRPLVSTLMYTVIPVDRRVVFGSACGVLWGIYLSLYAAV